MIIETIYKAVNGMKFYDKEECERYSNSVGGNENTVVSNGLQFSGH